MSTLATVLSLLLAIRWGPLRRPTTPSLERQFDSVNRGGKNIPSRDAPGVSSYGRKNRFSDEQNCYTYNLSRLSVKFLRNAGRFIV